MFFIYELSINGIVVDRFDLKKQIMIQARTEPAIRSARLPAESFFKTVELPHGFLFQRTKVISCNGQDMKRALAADAYK